MIHLSSPVFPSVLQLITKLVACNEGTKLYLYLSNLLDSPIDLPMLERQAYLMEEKNPIEDDMFRWVVPIGPFDKEMSIEHTLLIFQRHCFCPDNNVKIFMKFSEDFFDFFNLTETERKLVSENVHKRQQFG